MYSDAGLTGNVVERGMGESGGLIKRDCVKP